MQPNINYYYKQNKDMLCVPDYVGHSAGLFMCIILFILSASLKDGQCDCFLYKWEIWGLWKVFETELLYPSTVQALL